MPSKREARVKSVLKNGAIAIGLLCLLLAGCDKEQAPPEVEAVRPVKVMVLASSDEVVRHQYPGKVRAAQRADLSFEVAGKLKELPVREGQVVEQGKLIAKLDDRDFVSSLQSTQAEYDNAVANFERASKLVKDGHISKTDYDRLNAEKDVKAANLAHATKALEDSMIYAPFTGRVARRLVENFQDVQAKQAIVSLQDIEQLEILVDIPENRAIRIKGPDQQPFEVRAVFEASPGREFDLTLKEFSTEANPDTQTFEAVFSMPQPDGLTILPGMTAMVWGGAPEKEQDAGSFMIPAAALFADETGKSHVWVVDTGNNKVQKRAVQTGDLSGTDKIRVTDGLKAGEMLVISGVSRLREGMQIKPVDKVAF